MTTHNNSAPLVGRPAQVVENTPIQPPNFPPGKLGDVAHYLWRYAPSPVEEYAIATAIGFFAGICGRGWGINGTGLNHDIIVLGQSGTGKNVVHQGIANIVKQLHGTPILNFINNAQMASAPALLKFVTVYPCCVQLIGEVGKMYRAYSKSRYGDNIDQLFTAKLDLWERSGPDGMSVGINYSDSDKNVAGGTMRIAHSTIGESTPDVFYGALSTDNMNEGLLSRLWIFEYEGDEPIYNSDRSDRLPGQLHAHLRELVINASGRLISAQQPVQCSPEAEATFREFLQYCNQDKAKANGPAVRQLWVRAYEKVLRLAALCAVADNYVSPVISVQHADWAIETLHRTNENILDRIDEEIADDSDHMRELMVCDRIKRWLLTSRKDQKDQELANNSIVSRRFLQQEVTTKKIFTGHRLGAVTLFNLTMRSLVEQGYLQEMKKENLVKDYNVFGQCWRVLSLKER